MDGSKVTLSGFGDEISPELGEQLDTLEAEGITHLELRGVWKKNVLSLSEAEADRLKGELDRRGFGVSALASPIGKVPITDPIEPHMDQLTHALELARLFATRYLRVFSFFIPEGGDPAAYRHTVISRVRAFVQAAQGSGVTLLHENEKEIYGDTGERCRDVLEAVSHPQLRAIFDPANFVQCGVRPMTDAYPLLAPYIEYVHVKDAMLGDGSVKPAGQGDGEVKRLLGALKQIGFAGTLSLEPHLAHAGEFAGFSGPRLFRAAAQALKQLLAELSWEWQ